MGSRITDRFSRLAADNSKAFVAYLTAGDPDLGTTAAVLDALVEGGADVIELGVPFSDPMADGPVIQAAMGRALAAGTAFGDVLAVVRDFRARHPSVPLVLFGYLNPLYQYGLERACRDAAEAGADGFLVVDLPCEEAAELTAVTRRHGLDFIALYTPTADDERVGAISAHASGFAYYVSMAAITGDALTGFDTIAARAAAVKRISGLPVAVGFGIRTPADAARIAAFADGVVVGSAIVDAVANAESANDAADRVRQLTQDFCAAIR